MFLRDSQLAIDAQSGMNDIMLSLQARNMMEIARSLFPSGPKKLERDRVLYNLSFEDLGVLVVPMSRVSHFGNPIYVLGEKSLLRPHVIHIDEEATGYRRLVVIARESAGPYAAVDVVFEKSTLRQRDDLFQGNIFIRQWKDPHRQKDSGEIHVPLVYSASRRGIDTSGKALSDLWVHGLVVTAGCYLQRNGHEFDGFVVVD